MSNVSVTNKGKDTFVCRWDGVAFDFPPGEPTVIPELAAAFIFAYGQDAAARARVLIRNGWQRNNIPGDEFGPEAADKRLKGFVFKQAAEDAKRAAPEAQLLPQHRGKQPTGVNAMTPGLENDDRKIAARQPIALPGSRAPLAPPAV